MYKGFATILYDVTDIQTFIKRNINCACLIDEKKHIAP